MLIQWDVKAQCWNLEDLGLVCNVLQVFYVTLDKSFDSLVLLPCLCNADLAS